MEQPPEVTIRLIGERIAAGDRHAFDELYAEYAQSLFAYLAPLVPDHELAEETIQNTFLAVLTGADYFAGRSSVKSWLIGMARRQWQNAVFLHRRELVGEWELAPLPLPAPAPADLLIAEVSADDVATAIDRLTPSHREMIVLTFICGLSFPELADVFEVPIETVKSRLQSTKRALRVLLERGAFDARAMQATTAGAAREHVIDLLPAFASGTLDQLEAARVQAHLDQCAACRNERAIWRAVARAAKLAAKKRSVAFPGIYDRVWQAMFGTPSPDLDEGIGKLLMEWMAHGRLRTGPLGGRPSFTKRELAILRLVGEGKTNREIADALLISPQTVKNLVTTILRKLDWDPWVLAATDATHRGLR